MMTILSKVMHGPILGLVIVGTNTCDATIFNIHPLIESVNIALHSPRNKISSEIFFWNIFEVIS